MVKPHQHEPWGTLQELLLASAVNRHGTTNWDSISIELRNRFSQFSPFSLTPQDCRDKFYDLKKRFISQSQSESQSQSQSLVMLEELRKIRVEELRRDVQRRDVLIMSLEMKVKMLEEERQRSREAATDLETENPDDKTEESLADDRENRSLNESNSTSKKDHVRRENGVVQEEDGEEEVIVRLSNKETGPIRTGGEPGRKEEYVNNKRRERKEKERKTKWGKMKKRKTGDSIDAWESVSETKHQQKQQQSSDVQSSGSLSQKKRCRSSGEDPDELSPSPAKVSAVKSQPLLKFLEIIRSHRLGSLFERRLRSQESERYKKLIRVHVDLKTIHSRVVKGQYAHSIHRFFRDVLLLFNNAIIFFPKSSSEHIAALKLRPLVFKEIKDRIPIPLIRPDSSSTLIGCTSQRDSVIALPSSEVSSRKRNLEQKQPPKVDLKKVTHGSNIKIYEKGMWKKGMKERSRLANSGPGPSPSPRSSRTSKHNGEVKHEYGGNELSSHDAMEVPMEKKETVTKKKKQGAVSFLKRMKQNSPSEATEEDVDVSDQEDSLKEEEEENTKQGRRERVTRSGSGNAKKTIGRPPKRVEPVKRRRDESASGTRSGGKPRKRSRR